MDIRKLNLFEELYDPAKILGVISNYLGLKEYFGVVYKELGGNNRWYTNEEDYWKDALGTSFYKAESGEPILSQDVVHLKNFTLTEWFPRAPGLYWTNRGTESRYEAEDFIMEREGSTLIYSPGGKTRLVEGGVGNVRMLKHGAEKFKLLSATTSGYPSAGIPIVMPEGTYDKISSKVEDLTTTRVDLEGTYVPLPGGLLNLIDRAAGVPRYCVLVNSRLLLRNIERGGKISCAAWTVFESSTTSGALNYCHSHFDPSDHNSIDDTIHFIEEYVDEYGGKAITDFDEVVPRFDAQIKLQNIPQMSTDLNREILEALEVGNLGLVELLAKRSTNSQA